MVIFIVLSYLLGAVPFGVVFSRLFSGIDVRNAGSGNIGATNVLRTVGIKAAVLTLLADAIKGFIPVLVAELLFQNDILTALTGITVILGHDFPIFLGFKGGKGVATSFGVVLAVSPWIGLVCLLAWITAAAIWRFSSISALVAFALYPIVTFFITPSIALSTESSPYRLLSLFIFGMIYYRHRENMKRLLAGTESKIGKK